MINSNYISIDSNICHGKPVFAGTRIMVYLVLDMLEAGETYKSIIDAYPALTEEHIREALRFASSLSKNISYTKFPEETTYAIPSR